MRKNSNIFNIDSKSYRTNILLEFANPKIEASFIEDYASRQQYSLVCFQIFGILQCVYYYFAKGCYSDSTSCSYKPLLIITLLLYFGTILLLTHPKRRQKSNTLIPRILLLVSSVYFHVSALERFEGFIGWGLIFLQIYVANTVCFSQWKQHLIFFSSSLTLLFFLLWLFDKMIFREAKDNLLFLLISLLILTLYAAGQEKANKENWVIIDSFRKSERFLEKFIDESNSSIIVVDQGRNIMLCNLQAREFIRQVSGEKYKKIFQGNLLINFDELIAESINISIEQALENSEEVITCLLHFPDIEPEDERQVEEEPKPVSIPPKKSDGEVDKITKVPFELNFSQVDWRGKKAIIITISKQTHKLRKSQINSKITEFCSEILNQVFHRLTKQKHTYSLKKKRENKKKVLGDLALANSSAHLLSYMFLLSKETLDYFENSTQKMTVNFSLHDCLFNILEILSPFAREKNTELQLSFPSEIENHIVYADMAKLELIFIFLIKFLMDKSADANISLNCTNKSQSAEENLRVFFEISGTNVERNLSEAELKLCFNVFGEIITNPSLSETKFSQQINKLTFNDISLYMTNVFINRFEGEIKIDHEGGGVLKLGFEIGFDKGSAADKENTIFFPEIENLHKHIGDRGMSYIWSRSLEVESDDEEEGSIEENPPSQNIANEENNIENQKRNVGSDLRSQSQEEFKKEDKGEPMRNSLSNGQDIGKEDPVRKREKLCYASNVIDINILSRKNNPERDIGDESDSLHPEETNRKEVKQIASNAFDQLMSEIQNERMFLAEPAGDGIGNSEKKDFYVEEEMKKHFFYLEEGFMRTVENLLSDILKKKDENSNTVFYFPSKLSTVSPMKSNRHQISENKFNVKPASPMLREALLKRHVTGDMSEKSTERGKILEEDAEKLAKRADGDDDISVNFGGVNSESPRNKRDDEASGDLLDFNENPDKTGGTTKSQTDSDTKREFSNNPKKEWELREVELLKNQMRMKKSPRKPYDKDESALNKTQNKELSLDKIDPNEIGGSKLNEKGGWDIFRGVEECEKSKIVEVLDIQMQDGEGTNNGQDPTSRMSTLPTKMPEKENSKTPILEIEDPEERLIANQARLQRERRLKQEQANQLKAQAASQEKEKQLESKTATASPNDQQHKKNQASIFHESDGDRPDDDSGSSNMQSRPFRRPSNVRQLSDHVLSCSSSENFADMKKQELNQKLCSLVFDKKSSNSMNTIPHPVYHDSSNPSEGDHNPPKMHKKNILLIDEDPKSYKFLEELQSSSTEHIESVVWAPSEERAVEEINRVIKGRDFEIIIVDISKQSGLKAIERIFQIKKDMVSIVFALKGSEINQEHDNEFYKQYHIEYIINRPLIPEEFKLILGIYEPVTSILEGKNVLLISGNAGITVNFHFWRVIFKFNLQISLNEKDMEAKFNDDNKFFIVILDMPEKRANEILSTIIKYVGRQIEKPLITILKAAKPNEIRRSEVHKPVFKQNIINIEKPLNYHTLENMIREYLGSKSESASSQLLASPSSDIFFHRESHFNNVNSKVKSVKDDTSSSNDKKDNSSLNSFADLKSSPLVFQSKILDFTERSPSVNDPSPRNRHTYYPEVMILAVDDNNWILMNMSRIAISIKFKMESAMNADSGFERYQKALASNKVYHMIFIDVKMPKKDGLELTRQIRKHEKDFYIRRTYICGMKTDDDNPDDKDYLNSGMDDVCMKPIKKEIFDKLITDRLKKIADEELSMVKRDVSMNLPYLDHFLSDQIEEDSLKISSTSSAQGQGILKQSSENPSIKRESGPAYDQQKNNNPNPVVVTPVELKFCEKMTMLGVDDNNFFLMGMSHFPFKRKYAFEPATKADIAFEKFKKMCEQGLAYHLLFIDIKMPQKDGMWLIKEIRAYELSRNIKRHHICAMITDDDDPNESVYINAGFDDVCMKPIKPDAFAKILSERLDAIEGKQPAQPKIKFQDEVCFLTVDDNIMIHNAMSRQKTEIPYKMESSNNANDAFEKIKKKVASGFIYHIVFLDAIMPKENGIVACKKIREWEKAEGLGRIVYICGMRSIDDDIKEPECLEAGMDDVIIKPVRPEVFNLVFKNRLNQVKNLK